MYGTLINVDLQFPQESKILPPKKFCSDRPFVLNEMRIEKCFKIMFIKWIKEQFLTEQIQHVFDAGTFW